jgi:hypothetical protein
MPKEKTITLDTKKKREMIEKFVREYFSNNRFANTTELYDYVKSKIPFKINFSVFSFILQEIDIKHKRAGAQSKIYYLEGK